MLIKGFGAKRANRLIEKLAETKSQREVAALLAGCENLSPNKLGAIFDTFGDKAADVIKHNPYRLNKVNGLSFTAVEKIAKKLGGNPCSPDRIEGGIIHTGHRTTGRH